MHPDINQPGRRLYVALGFLGLDVPPPAMPPELRALHAWLDTWHGIGLIAHGMAPQDRDLSVTRYRDAQQCSDVRSCGGASRGSPSIAGRAAGGE